MRKAHNKKCEIQSNVFVSRYAFYTSLHYMDLQDLEIALRSQIEPDQ
jgi:hypothetical protein